MIDVTKKYQINKLFISQRDDKDIVVIEDNGYYDFDNRVVFNVICTLKDYIIDNNLEMYLYNEAGSTKTYFTIQDCKDILNIVQLKKTIPFQEEKKLKITSLKLANFVSDLLGINITNMPRTSINKEDIENIVLSAKKASMFRSIISSYIFLSLIKDKRIKLTNKDYRVLLALKKSNIKTDKILNNAFTINVETEGEVKISSNINQSFQKTIKL